MFHSEITPPTQGEDSAHAQLDVIDGHLVDPVTGEVVGVVPADLDAQNHHCCKYDTPGAAPRENDPFGAGSLVNREGLYLAGESPFHERPEEARQSGTTVVRHPRATQPETPHRSPTGLPWFDVGTYKGHKVGRTINHATRLNAIEAAGFAADDGHPLTVHLTQRPRLDVVDPAGRIGFWSDMRQELAGIGQTIGEPDRYIRVREANARSHAGEHAHWLLAIPPEKIPRWAALVKKRCPDTRITHIYDFDGAVQYVLKAVSPETLRSGDDIRFVRRSGAIVGDRVLISRSLGEKVRAKAYAADPALVERREQRLVMESTDRRIRKEKRAVAALIASASQSLHEPIEA